MHLSLYSKPQCLTQSNALEISRKTPLTSKLELASKGVVKFMNNRNELMHTGVSGTESRLMN